MTLLVDLPTPSLILDKAALERNLDRMRVQAARLGVRLRPHLKTAKSAEVARLALGPDGDGITVSTLAEARYFAEHGFRDITYAVGIVPAKLPEAARLIKDGVALKLLTDDPEVAAEAAVRGVALGVVFDILIEIDSGQGRGGIAPDDPRVIEIARALDGRGARLAGVLTHAGHSYRCKSPDEIADLAERERQAATGTAERLRVAGHPVDIVSVGSTPTALCARALDGVTEMRPGVYMFMDLFQHGLGLCGEDDIAVSVMAAVIGRHPERGQYLIDAGALALSQDASRAGYGRVRKLGLHVASVNQEHGFLRAAEGQALPDLHVGDRVRILPNHACMTSAMYDVYHVVEGERVVATWDRCRGW